MDSFTKLSHHSPSRVILFEERKKQHEPGFKTGRGRFKCLTTVHPIVRYLYVCRYSGASYEVEPRPLSSCWHRVGTIPTGRVFSFRNCLYDEVRAHKSTPKWTAESDLVGDGQTSFSTDFKHRIKFAVEELGQKYPPFHLDHLEGWSPDAHFTVLVFELLAQHP